MEWFKFYGKDFLSDMKMTQLSVSERLAWVTLLCLAHEEDKGGDIRYCTEDLLRVKMGLREDDKEWKDLDGVFKVFFDLGMIEIREGNVFVKNFQKRQEKYLIPAEKMARYRAKKKAKGNESYRGRVTKVTSRREEKRREEKTLSEDKSSRGVKKKL